MSLKIALSLLLAATAPSDVFGALLRFGRNDTQGLNKTEGGQAPRHVFVDLGANWANTLRLYQDIAHGYAPHGQSWEIYAFEASPFIQPYLEHFTAFLNGWGAKPPLTIPPSGSSWHLADYAPRYGCPNTVDDAMRECMFQVFKKPLSELHPDMSLSNWDIIHQRLALAAQPLAPGAPDRFVAIPAAAGAENGELNLGLMTAEQMIRGGAVNSEEFPGTGAEMKVALVDFPTWLATNFLPTDYVVVKMDIEGAEFPILNKIFGANQGCLMDMLAIECHHWGGDCNKLSADIAQWACITKLDEIAGGYRAYDHYSTPDLYYPIDPRTR